MAVFKRLTGLVNLPLLGNTSNPATVFTPAPSAAPPNVFSPAKLLTPAPVIAPVAAAVILTLAVLYAAPINSPR